jgi:hypothetical protein
LVENFLLVGQTLPSIHINAFELANITKHESICKKGTIQGLKAPSMYQPMQTLGMTILK